MKGSNAKGRAYASKMPFQDKESEARGSRRGCGHGGAGSRAAGHLTYNQTPGYIRGSRPLD
jgi:hypothetical protein